MEKETNPSVVKDEKFGMRRGERGCRGFPLTSLSTLIRNLLWEEIEFQDDLNLFRSSGFFGKSFQLSRNSTFV